MPYYVKMWDIGETGGRAFTDDIGETETFDEAKTLLVAELRSYGSEFDDGEGELYEMAAAEVEAKMRGPGAIDVGVGAELPEDYECEDGECPAPGYTTWEIFDTRPHDWQPDDD